MYHAADETPRLAELEALASRTTEQDAELKRLRDTRDTGWGAESKLARAKFLETEVAEGRLKFEFKAGESGRPGMGTFVGAGIIIVAVGSWLISEAPEPTGPPTRSKRN